MPTAHDHAEALRQRLSRDGRLYLPADPLSLAINACAHALATAAAAPSPDRMAHAHLAGAYLPGNATAFERGLTLGLAFALLSEPKQATGPEGVA